MVGLDAFLKSLATLKFCDQELIQETVLLVGSFLRFLNGALLHTAGNYRRLQWPQGAPHGLIDGW